MHKPRSCPSQAALEEHAAALHLGKGNPDVERHAAECSRCRKRIRALADEAARLRNALLSAQKTPQTPCPDSQTLAAYLDNALEPAARLLVEQHAAQCPQCRLTLANTLRDTRDIVSERSAVYEAQPPVALADRKRTKRTLPKRKKTAEKLDTRDGETRKKRLSSDFD